MKRAVLQNRVAIVGAGMAGASCAAGLRSAGIDVTVFEKSGNVGGRMATRRAAWRDASGSEHHVSFDHGAQSFTARRPRFRATLARAITAGSVLRWQPLVHASPSARAEPCFVAAPAMPALSKHLLAGASVHLNRTVRRIQRASDGAWYVVTDDATLSGPFRYVVVAVPPEQAAVLLSEHHDAWAASLIAGPMDPCWTLMAVTDEVDWPWDAVKPDRGPFSWLSRNDRIPARRAHPGYAVWTGHATQEWSERRLEADAQAVRDELQAALQLLLPASGASRAGVSFYHSEAHRWRYAGPAPDCEGSVEALWDASLGIGVCGDWLGGNGGVEAAWHSGDELADHMAASFERADIAPEMASALV